MKELSKNTYWFFFFFFFSLYVGLRVTRLSMWTGVWGSLLTLVSCSLTAMIALWHDHDSVHLPQTSIFTSDPHYKPSHHRCITDTHLSPQLQLNGTFFSFAPPAEEMHSNWNTFLFPHLHIFFLFLFFFPNIAFTLTYKYNNFWQNRSVMYLGCNKWY